MSIVKKILKWCRKKPNRLPIEKENKMLELEINQLYIADGWEKPRKFIGNCKQANFNCEIEHYRFEDLPPGLGYCGIAPTFHYGLEKPKNLRKYEEIKPMFEYGQLYVSAAWKNPRVYKGFDPYDSGFFIFQEPFDKGGNVYYCNSLNSHNIKKYEKPKFKINDHEECKNKIRAGDKVWCISQKKVLTITNHFQDFMKVDKDGKFFDIIKLSEFEPEMGKKYNFRKGFRYFDLDMFPLEFKGKYENGDGWIFLTPDGRETSWLKEVFIKYLIGEYEGGEKTENNYCHTEMGCLQPGVEIKIGEPGVYAQWDGKELKILKEETKMREFDKTKKYNVECCANNPCKFIYRSEESGNVLFEDARGWFYTFSKNLYSLGEATQIEITEHRELEVKRFEKYTALYINEEIKRDLDSQTFYDSLVATLEEKAEEETKIYKLDITATEVSQEEIDKVKGGK